MQKGMNKRGQDVTLGMIALIIIIGVTVIFAILFFTGVFDRLNAGGSQLPQDLTIMVSACKLKVDNSLKSEYCSDVKKVTLTNGKEIYATCSYLQTEASTSSLFEGASVNCDMILPPKGNETCVNNRIKSGKEVYGISAGDPKPQLLSCEKWNTTP